VKITRNRESAAEIQVTIWRGTLFILSLLAFARVQATPVPVVLGPLNPGAERGTDNWYRGTNGEAWVSVDDSDAATGGSDFSIGNKASGKPNSADWRSQMFPLGRAARGGSPITFSFAYKLPEKLNGRENIQVFLRFFDAAGTNFFGQRIFRIGSHTGSSGMTNYQKVLVSDIRSPRRAQAADVWITANIFEPWTSGCVRFDDFSATTTPGMSLAMFTLYSAMGGIATVIAIMAAKSRRKPRAHVPARARVRH
jgi:hypothetical protein